MAVMLFPAGVLGLAVAMLVAHRASWQHAKTRLRNAVDLSFRYHQFRRRTQASSLLALVAPTMLVGLRVSPDRSPKIFIALWLLVMLATCWIGWLAVQDAIASARHYRRLARERATTRISLRREFERIVAAQRENELPPGEIAPNDVRAELDCS